MTYRNEVQFDSDDYTVFDDTVLLSVSLTEREKAYISSALSLMFYRDDWEEMSDTDWDNLENKLSIIAGKIT
jgi:hypothetical protein